MTTGMTRLDALDVSGQRLLIREDLNVPVADGRIQNDARLQRALPTLQYALDQSACVMVMSHWGRPQEGVFDQAYSLEPVRAALSEWAGYSVPLLKDWLEGVEVAPGRLVLCENVRFCVGETRNDPFLAKKMADLCDVFVMDAFATAHRSHASTAGVATYAPISCAGPLLLEELAALDQVRLHPEKPSVAIVGGSKVDTKMALLVSLVQQVDTLIVGGGIANTFLKAQGHDVGRSLVDGPEGVAQAQHLLAQAETLGASIVCPKDVVVATDLETAAGVRTCGITEVGPQECIFDVGPGTLSLYQTVVQSAKTILWNGPVGVFEKPPFDAGTQRLGEYVAASSAYSVAGGGDTIAAIEQFGLKEGISYSSTGGGAFLSYMQGDTLPGVSVLMSEEA